MPRQIEGAGNDSDRPSLHRQRHPIFRTCVYEANMHVYELRTRLYEANTRVYGVEMHALGTGIRVYEAHTGLCEHPDGDFFIRTCVYEASTSTSLPDTRVYERMTRRGEAHGRLPKVCDEGCGRGQHDD